MLVRAYGALLPGSFFLFVGCVVWLYCGCVVCVCVLCVCVVCVVCVCVCMVCVCCVCYVFVCLCCVCVLCVCCVCVVCVVCVLCVLFVVPQPLSGGRPRSMRRMGQQPRATSSSPCKFKKHGYQESVRTSNYLDVGDR